MNSGDLRTNSGVLPAQQPMDRTRKLCGEVVGYWGPVYSADRVRCTQPTGFGVLSRPGSVYSADRVRCTQPTGFGVLSRPGSVYSADADGEFLDDRVREQFCRDLRDPGRCGVRSHRFGRLCPSSGWFDSGWFDSSWFGSVGPGFAGLVKLDLEPLALADGDHVTESQPVAGTDDRLALRVVDFGLEHDVDDNLDHGTQRTRLRLLTEHE